MRIFNKITDIKAEIKKIKSSGRSVGLVPTMGFLHEGHMSLVRESVKNNDVTVVSIFVNPTQFGPTEDLAAYPRDFESDCALLEKNNADIIFYPEPSEMYGEGFCTKVELSGITEVLCGITRPVHFAGVATVVTKLFNIVNPDRAYFGSKDYQQLQVIKRMIKDLNMDVDVVGMPIIRENDGLALSSRNVYLKGDERTSALALSGSFKLVENLLREGVEDTKTIKEKVADFILSHPHTRIDYIETVHPETLVSVDSADTDFVMALAVYVGKARLIDNRYFEVHHV
ncbi:pantoate--beta-alanine ligase [Seleniivibrio sp.]|uniref:pantoate--beta-alanine ligase n=1 Tax=Seleniivibrio sp. TaxID=2898801 RepID=UPI0025E603B0|nr:pantoate--beta-alanine ligase [Seleniivibrio sp.]MCD8552957.1 pantoate--beta-alanine ligase [Seleniivibrio sp.]